MSQDLAMFPHKAGIFGAGGWGGGTDPLEPEDQEKYSQWRRAQPSFWEAL